MIFVEMKGRLGNQMFKYAFARWMQEKRGNTDELVFNFNDIYDTISTESGWEDSLKYFNVKPYTKYSKKGSVLINETHIIQKILCGLCSTHMMLFGNNNREKRIACAMHWQSLLNKFGVIWLSEKYYPFCVPKSKNIIINGGFQCKKYFDEIKDKLLEEFTPKAPKIKENLNLYDVITNTNSVCITIRRGDYVTVEKFRELYDICDINYFLKATELIKKEIQKPVFIVFSDDIEWVRANIDFGSNVYYESGNDQVWEKLRLMYSCKHFILSNSSFSWWAQYLSRNEEKVVISPTRWYKDGFNSPLIDENWIKIKV